MRRLRDTVIASYAAEAGVPYNASCVVAFCVGLVAAHYYTVWEHPNFLIYLAVKLIAVVAMVVPVFILSAKARGFLSRKAWMEFQTDQNAGAEIIPFAAILERHRPPK